MNYVAYWQAILDGRLKEVGAPCEGELLRLYTLLALVIGKDVDNSDVHDAWAIWANIDRPEHKSIVRYEELDRNVQALDTVYRDAIVWVAELMSRERG